VATVTGLTLIKQFTYRGQAGEEFSNTYWFKNNPPGGPDNWDVLANDILVIEQRIFPSTVTFSRAIGYDSNDDHAQHVYQTNFAVPGPPPQGTFAATAGDIEMAGDQAACIQWPTDRIAGKGKRTYLRKFMHAGYVAPGAPADALSNDYGAALILYGDQMRTQHGGLRSRLNDLNVVGTSVSPWVTTRTLKRRGKKKKPS